MANHDSERAATASGTHRLFATATAAVLLALGCTANSFAAVTTIGSPLAAPATLNTADNLDYRGIDTAVPPSPGAPSGVVHTAHYGADSVLWNTSLAGGDGGVPADGQALTLRLEGCAVPAPGGPAPLTQIHFQVLSPQPGGGATVKLSSQPFNIPTCGVGGASGSTISSYQPINLCVSRGDYLAFNDEGGFVEGSYRAGVPFRVIGSASGSTLSSFIRGNGTGNGSLLSPLDTTPMDGFAVSHGEELMMQAVLGTGTDARYVCPGGSKEGPRVFAPIGVHAQTDGVNAHRIVKVAIYCRPAQGCSGIATLTLAGSGSGSGRGALRHGLSLVGQTPFTLPGGTTSHLPIRISEQLMHAIRAHHGAAAALTVVVGTTSITQTVHVKIF